MCEKVETLYNGRVKVKIDKLILSVKPECLLHSKIELKTFCKCKVMYYCNFECFKKHWKEGGHKDECREWLGEWNWWYVLCKIFNSNKI